MLSKVFVIGKAGFDSYNLVDQLSENETFDVELLATPSEALQRLRQQDAALVVFNMDLIHRNKMGMVDQFRELGYGMPFLIYARVVARDVYRAVEGLPQTIVLEKPCEQKRLWGVISKMLQGESVRQPVYRRFYTDQSVKVQPMDSSDHVEGNIYNLSLGGAYIECEDAAFQVGDFVRFSVRLSELARKYVVNGKVVWATGSGEHTGRPGFGVAFLKSGEIYQTMLKKL